MPDVLGGATLRIVGPAKEKDANPNVVWSRRAPETPPRITHFEVHTHECRGNARWEVLDTNRESLQVSLQYSPDGGKSWNGLAVGLTVNEFCFDLSTLPSGEVIFALLAHDGFFTTRHVSRMVVLPRRAPVIAIMHPYEGDTLVEEQPLRLWVSASTCTAERVADRACRWLIDGHEVAHGVEVWIATPGPGEHRCTVVVSDEEQRSEATVGFRVEGRRDLDRSHETCR
jgi:hypothetical protein